MQGVQVNAYEGVLGRGRVGQIWSHDGAEKGSLLVLVVYVNTVKKPKLEFSLDRTHASGMYITNFVSAIYSVVQC